MFVQRRKSPAASGTIVGTFSIVARDIATGELGVATQSRFIAVGSAVPWAKAEVGAVATQALANVSFGPRGLELMEAGVPAQEALDRLLASDDGRDLRQVALLDCTGNGAAFTGRECLPWAGHRLGSGYVCLGNVLANENVVTAMAEAYELSTPLPHLADRLIATLQAGQAAGGDRRGMQSAALYVVRAGGGYEGIGDRVVDLRVDDHSLPIGELERLLAIHRQVLFQPTPPARWYPETAERNDWLQTLLRELGDLDGPTSAGAALSSETRAALATCCARLGLVGLQGDPPWLPGETIAALWRAAPIPKYAR